MNRALIFAFVLASSAASAQNFSAGGGMGYEVPVYKGPIKYPQFDGRDKEWRMFRTRIQEGFKGGVKFAGKYALIQFGCGTHCLVTLLGDVSTGRVIRMPQSGEGGYYDQLDVKPNSRFAHTRWDDSERCYSEDLVMETNGQLRTLNKRDIGSHETCY